MTDSALVCQPIAGPERIDMLDALRGFALFGILLMNLEAFTGPISQAITGIDARLAGADRWSDAFIYIFVQGKFWTLFSTLFGVGFALMFVFAVLLPTVDPVSLALEVIPLVILFELSVQLASVMERRWDIADQKSRWAVE